MNLSAPGSSWTVLPAASGSASAGPTSSASASFAAAPSASASSGATASARTGQQPRKHRRLPPEAHQFLREFYNTVTTNPKKQQRIALAEQVARISGYTDYTEANITGYFANKRKQDRDRARKESQAGSITSAAVLYPRLLKHPSILPAVDACLRDFPDPTPEIAEIIAQQVGRGVKLIDIINYAKCRRAQSGTSPPPLNTASNPSPGSGSVRYDQHPPASNVAHQHASGVQIPFQLPPFQRTAPPRSQLPTPASSTSPEPRSQPTSPVVESSWGQVEAEEDDDEDVKDELCSDDEMALETEGSEQPSEASLDSRLHDLAGTLQQSLSRLAPLEPLSSPPPKTFAELAGWLQQDTTSSAILQGITQGAYAPIGLSGAPSLPTLSR